MEDLHVKLRTVERSTTSREDRVRQMEKAIEDERSSQHKLTDMVARLLAKKHYVGTRLQEQQDIAKNIETENSVCLYAQRSDWANWVGLL